MLKHHGKKLNFPRVIFHIVHNMEIMIARVNIEKNYYCSLEQEEQTRENFDINDLSEMFKDTCIAKNEEMIPVDNFFKIKQSFLYNGDSYIQIRNIYGSYLIAKLIKGSALKLQRKSEIYIKGYRIVNDSEIEVLMEV